MSLPRDPDSVPADPAYAGRGFRHLGVGVLRQEAFHDRELVEPTAGRTPRPVASTVSRRSTTSIVADSLWGSTPMNTLAMSFALPVIVS